MQNLLDIEGVDSDTCSLLEAAGYVGLDSLKSNSPEVICAELAKANKMLKIMDQEPSLEQVKSWCESLTEKVAYRSIIEAGAEISTLQDESRVPMASPISESFVEKHSIELAKLPKLTKLPDVADLAEENKVLADISKKEVLPAPSVKCSKPSVVRGEEKKVGVDKEKIKSIEDYRSIRSSLTPHERRDDANHMREAKPGTNEGVDPSQEKYIRGVLHNDAQRTYFGAWGYILACLLLVSSVAPIIYILFQREHYVWGVLTPVILLLALVFYLLVARESSCPVCRQRQFVPKACRKHVKAHSWPMLGNMLPTAWHLVRYKWFRCIFCGTSIRVKE